MTVVELIRLLQECSPEKEVTIYDYGYGDWYSVVRVEEDDNDVKLNFEQVIKVMKVKELIDKLKDYPEDTEVIVLDIAWGDNVVVIAAKS